MYENVVKKLGWVLGYAKLPGYANAGHFVTDTLGRVGDGDGTPPRASYTRAVRPFARLRSPPKGDARPTWATIWASVSSSWAPISSTSNSPPSEQAGACPVAQKRPWPARASSPGILHCYKESSVRAYAHAAACLTPAALSRHTNSTNDFAQSRPQRRRIT